MKPESGQATEFVPITPDEETQATVAHLNTLAQIASDYELNSPSLIRQLNDELQVVGEAAARKRLDDCGIGRSAQAVKKARKLFDQTFGTK